MMDDLISNIENFKAIRLMEFKESISTVYNFSCDF